MDYFLIKRPLNNDVFCGDTGIIKEFDNKVFIGIIDALGHGERAHKIAVICEDFIEKNYRRDLVETMKDLDACIRGTRGAVGALCQLELKTGVLQYVGVGDTTARIFGPSHATLISKPGIIGYTMPSLSEDTKKISDGDVLVLYTDGVQSYFELKDYSGLLNHGAKEIATRIIEHYGKETDDALCIALKYNTE